MIALLGENALGLLICAAEFRKGNENLEDYPTYGRSAIAITKENIDRFHQIVMDDMW